MDCIFHACYDCSGSTDKLIKSEPNGERLKRIIEASTFHNDSIGAALEKCMENEHFKAAYHKSCVSKYILLSKRIRDKSKRKSSEQESGSSKSTRSSSSLNFDWLNQCFYCGTSCNVTRDPKNPARWNPAYLFRETEPKGKEDSHQKTIEERICDKCGERNDVWADTVAKRLACLSVKASDFHAADARYHR